MVSGCCLQASFWGRSFVIRLEEDVSVPWSIFRDGMLNGAGLFFFGVGLSAGAMLLGWVCLDCLLGLLGLSSSSRRLVLGLAPVLGLGCGLRVWASRLLAWLCSLGCFGGVQVFFGLLVALAFLGGCRPFDLGPS